MCKRCGEWLEKATDGAVSILRSGSRDGPEHRQSLADIVGILTLAFPVPRRLVQRREFDLRVRGTIRWIAGLQSLLSLGLLTLAALTVLGHPIE